MNKIKNNRLYEQIFNQQGDSMIIIKYTNANDIVVQFQDTYKAKVHTNYNNFIKGFVKNPYHPSICGVGMIGVKYNVCKNSKAIKEYVAWVHMLTRCFDEKFKIKNPTYKDVTCCDEWLLYENFYEWLHSQENFEKWLEGKRWALDKDILVKNNKIYSPETCCLVPHNVNCVFLKRDKYRSDLPIGVDKVQNKFVAYCSNSISKKTKEHLGTYTTIEEAFYSYKRYKEKLIRQIAYIEYSKNNITKDCYKAMMNYRVEITD